MRTFFAIYIVIDGGVLFTPAFGFIPTQRSAGRRVVSTLPATSDRLPVLQSHAEAAPVNSRVGMTIQGSAPAANVRQLTYLLRPCGTLCTTCTNNHASDKRSPFSICRPTGMHSGQSAAGLGIHSSVAIAHWQIHWHAPLSTLNLNPGCHNPQSDSRLGSAIGRRG